MIEKQNRNAKKQWKSAVKKDFLPLIHSICTINNVIENS